MTKSKRPSTQHPAGLRIEPARGTRLRSALELALAGAGDAVRQAMVGQLLAESSTQPDLLDGLFIAQQQGQTTGAVFVQQRGADSAHVWPPHITAQADPAVRVALLGAAADWLATRPLREAQTLLETDAGPMAEAFVAAGFEHVANLLYMVCTSRHFPDTAPAGPLEWVPVDPADAAALEAVIDATYRGTQDCAKWSRPPCAAEALAGYRQELADEHRCWQLALRDGGPVGCLLLADHPLLDQTELVYMGVVPEQRGQGWGLELVRHAQWQTSRFGRSRLVLAVDSENAPALAIYAATGFAAWDHRSVYLWRAL